MYCIVNLFLNKLSWIVLVGQLLDLTLPKLHLSLIFVDVHLITPQQKNKKTKLTMISNMEKKERSNLVPNLNYA